LGLLRGRLHVPNRRRRRARAALGPRGRQVEDRVVPAARAVGGSQETEARDLALLCDRQFPIEFLKILPSFMMTIRFFSGSAISAMLARGSPSMSSRSASAPSATTPRRPGYGLRFPDSASNWALVPVAITRVSAGVYHLVNMTRSAP